MKNQLQVHEWLAVVILLSTLSMLILIANFRSSASPSEELLDIPHHMTPQEIEVIVEGAVEHPGTYNLKKGSLVQDALNASKPLPEADLSKLKLDSKLRNGKKIYVPNRNTIIIHIDGAVKKPGPHIVKRDTRLNELQDQIELTDEADRSFFDKKRKLKDQETLYIPKKALHQSTR